MGLERCDPNFTEAEFSAELHVGDHVLVDVTGQGAVRVGGVEEVIVRQQSCSSPTTIGRKPHWCAGSTRNYIGAARMPV